MDMEAVTMRNHFGQFDVPIRGFFADNDTYLAQNLAETVIFTNFAASCEGASFCFSFHVQRYKKDSTLATFIRLIFSYLQVISTRLFAPKSVKNPFL